MSNAGLPSILTDQMISQLTSKAAHGCATKMSLPV